VVRKTTALLVEFFVLLSFFSCAPFALRETEPAKDSCWSVSRIEPFVITAMDVVRAVSTDIWPNWQAGTIPVVYTHEDSSKWSFFGLAAVGKRGLRCDSELGPVHRLSGPLSPNEKNHFFASADLEDGILRLEIASPAMATFPLSIWFAVFTHEYFHCHQFSQEDWLALSQIALAGKSRGDQPLKKIEALYQEDNDFRKRVDQQLGLLREILSSKEIDQGSLEELLQIRSEHHSIIHAIDARLGKVELAGEVLEGTARFVETRIFANEKVQKAIRQIAPQEQLPDAEQEQRNALRVRKGKYYYATGYGLSVLTNRLVPGWQERLVKEGFDSLLKTAAQLQKE
jgi:hypothetical protein